MASVTYGKCIMANVIMAKIFMAKILWQMKLSRISFVTGQLTLKNLSSFYVFLDCLHKWEFLRNKCIESFRIMFITRTKIDRKIWMVFINGKKSFRIMIITRTKMDVQF